METKKKRGCNYTSSEKDMLIELVKKHQHIIENKETNSNMILKKREAWTNICKQYNAVAASGCRSWEQLRHLYENLKQRSKKNIANANRQQFYEKTRVDMKEVQSKASLDKKEINRTGGGSYRSTISDHDALILSMVAPQVQPLANPYDDAALYFGDTEKNNFPDEVEASSNIVLYETVNIDDQDYIVTNNTIITENIEPCTQSSNLQDGQDNIITNDIRNTENTERCTVTSNPRGDQEIITFNTSKKRKLLRSTSNPSEQVKHNSNLKDQYFKIKVQNAKIEKKYLINKNKMAINKYKLEMEILKLRLKRMQPSKKISTV
ncbi:uncharacterized protein LOC121735007 [Aricia agestis]|uniref:uncharacterized protein LOC121735007 n=1 Tax=Aricia agestis TaxID=91739 RepID=UPI001C201FD6|nr:uncharacterized protein LOC121735007 [Aricia agestis]